MPRRTFRLAPMDTTVAVLSVVVVVALVGGLFAPLLKLAQEGAPIVVLGVGTAASLTLTAIFAAILVAIYGYMRPRRFELSEAGLRILWPLREELVPLRAIEGAELVTRRELHARYGRGYRFGAGGFLGGFGLYKTPKLTFRLYVSRLEPMALVHVAAASGLSLLLTPESPEQFIEELRRSRWSA